MEKIATGLQNVQLLPLSICLEWLKKNIKILPKINSGLRFPRLRVKKNEDRVINWKGR